MAVSSSSILKQNDITNFQGDRITSRASGYSHMHAWLTIHPSKNQPYQPQYVCRNCNPIKGCFAVDNYTRVCYMCVLYLHVGWR